MRIIKNKKGATFVTVLSIIMAACILVVGFTTISFWSFSATNRKVESNKTDALLASLVDSMVSDILGDNSLAWTKELDAINVGDTYKNVAVGNFTVGDSVGEIRLQYVDSTKKNVNLQASLNGRKKGVTLKKTYKSQVQEEMEKIYDNTFFFPSTNYWNQQISVEGNIFFGGSGSMSIGTRINPHIGDVMCTGNLELNMGSTINGNVCVKGNLKLNSNVLVTGNIEVGGNVEMAATSGVGGNLVCLGPIMNNGGYISGDVKAKEFDFSNNRQTQISGSLSYTTKLKINGATMSETQVQKYVVKSIQKVDSLPSLDLPAPVNRNDWKAPTLTETIIPVLNEIDKSGNLDLNRISISKNMPLILNTEKSDLHIIMKGNLAFAKDIILKGKNRAFIYTQGELNLSGHVGKMIDFDGADYPSQCRIFFIGMGGYPTFRLGDGGRLDGYVYFKSGAFTATGKGIYSKSGEYKIVGSVCSNMTHIEPSVTGKVVFASPDLNDIPFGGDQSSGETTIIVWEVDRYD